MNRTWKKAGYPFQIRRHTISGRRQSSDISQKSLKMGNGRSPAVKDHQRPFYRDDIFYGGSLNRLSHYKSQVRLGNLVLAENFQISKFRIIYNLYSKFIHYLFDCFFYHNQLFFKHSFFTTLFIYIYFCYQNQLNFNQTIF